jgi:hypothetical protein
MGNEKRAREIITQYEGKCLLASPRANFFPLFFLLRQVNIPMEFFNRNVIPLNLMCSGMARRRKEKMIHISSTILKCHNFHPSKYHKVINRTVDHQSPKNVMNFI